MIMKVGFSEEIMPEQKNRRESASTQLKQTHNRIAGRIALPAALGAGVMIQEGAIPS